MKYLFTLFCFLTLSLSFAQGNSISGTITDDENKQPIKGTEIIITFFKSIQYKSTTDNNGKYTITTNTLFPDGDYTLQINHPDYYALNGFIHVKKESTFNFTLKRRNTPKVITAIIDTPIRIKPILEGFATNNLVFLLDISSSMNTPERMPILKEAMKYLIKELRNTDKVAILTFSKGVKEILASTPANNKDLIYKTIDDITFGSTSEGSTALDAAYKTAVKNHITKGNNRIVLASDGLITTGEKDYTKMKQTIENGLNKDISLSIFCFGKTTEYVSSKLKKLAATGKGNYANITAIEQAKEFMLEEAKAVKE